MFDSSIEPLVSLNTAGNAAHAANIRLTEIEARLASLKKAVERASLNGINTPVTDWGYAGSYTAACGALEDALRHMGVDFFGAED